MQIKSTFFCIFCCFFCKWHLYFHFWRFFIPLQRPSLSSYLQYAIHIQHIPSMPHFSFVSSGFLIRLFSFFLSLNLLVKTGYHFRIEFVEQLRMVGVPYQRTVKLRLGNPMPFQHLVIILAHSLVVAVVVAGILQDGLGTMQVVQHITHLPRGQNALRSAPGHQYHHQQHSGHPSYAISAFQFVLSLAQTSADTSFLNQINMAATAQTIQLSAQLNTG